MKNIALCLILGVAAVTSGCAYKAGTEITQAEAAKFQIGKTTKSEILAALGTPQKMTQDGDDSWLEYSYSEINAFAGNKAEKTTFVIGKNDVLKNIMKGKGDDSGNPLLNAAVL